MRAWLGLFWAGLCAGQPSAEPAPGVELETAAHAREREAAADHPVSVHTPLTPPPTSDVVEAWGMYMEDFVPNMLLSFALPARGHEVFYQECNASDYVRGAYFCSTDSSYLDLVTPGSTPNVQMSVYSPSGQLISRQTTAEGIFYFEAGEQGSYAFHLENRALVEATVATLTLGVGRQGAAGNTREARLSQVDALVSEIMSESQYLWIRQQSHLKAVSSVHSRVICFSVIEMIVASLVAVFQVYYIMGVISDRRMI